MEISGKDTAAGFNVSLLYTPLNNDAGKPLANIGLVYRSQATLHLEGDLRANGTRIARTQTTLVLPQVFTGGMALWPVRDQDHEWKLELDVDYTGWKSFRKLDLQLSNGTTIPFPQDWQNVITLMLGTEYKWLRPAALPEWELAMRLGYAYGQSPVPDQHYNPTLPADADNHSITVGGGFLCKGHGKFLGLFVCGNPEAQGFFPKAIGLDLAYQAILYESRTVSGAESPIGIPGTLDGTYQTTFHIGSINLRVMF